MPSPGVTSSSSLKPHLGSHHTGSMDLIQWFLGKGSPADSPMCGWGTQNSCIFLTLESSFEVFYFRLF